MVRRLFAGGNRIRTIGPASGKVVDAKFQRSHPVRSNTDFGRRCWSSLEGRDIELSVSPKDIRTSPYDLCANRSDRRQSREGDRWFESTSLQRRVGRTLTGGAHRLGIEPRKQNLRDAALEDKIVRRAMVPRAKG